MYNRQQAKDTFVNFAKPNENDFGQTWDGVMFKEDEVPPFGFYDPQRARPYKYKEIAMTQQAILYAIRTTQGVFKPEDWAVLLDFPVNRTQDIELYVGSLKKGLNAKNPVDKSLHLNMNLATPIGLGGYYIAGQSYALMGQTDASENGIYILGDDGLFELKPAIDWYNTYDAGSVFNVVGSLQPNRLWFIPIGAKTTNGDGDREAFTFLNLPRYALDLSVFDRWENAGTTEPDVEAGIQTGRFHRVLPQPIWENYVLCYSIKGAPATSPAFVQRADLTDGNEFTIPAQDLDELYDFQGRVSDAFHLTQIIKLSEVTPPSYSGSEALEDLELELHLNPDPVVEGIGSTLTVSVLNALNDEVFTYEYTQLTGPTSLDISPSGEDATIADHNVTGTGESYGIKVEVSSSFGRAGESTIEFGVGPLPEYNDGDIEPFNQPYESGFPNEGNYNLSSVSVPYTSSYFPDRPTLAGSIPFLGSTVEIFAFEFDTEDIPFDRYKIVVELAHNAPSAKNFSLAIVPSPPFGSSNNVFVNPGEATTIELEPSESDTGVASFVITATPLYEIFVVYIASIRMVAK